MILNKKRKPNQNDTIPFLALACLKDRAIIKHVKYEINQDRDKKWNPGSPLIGKTSKYQNKI